jgi:uncharacterized DUF497 family protein
MEFVWDEEKRKTNLRNHDIDFVGVEAVFEGLTITIVDDRFDYGESRYVTYGLWGYRVVSIVHTESDGSIRIISVRKATRSEETTYYREIAD